MITLLNDYSEGAHPRILEWLQKTNMQACAGYGEDEFCLQAAALIHAQIQAPQAAIHFASGGTQTNTLLIKSILRPHEAVIAAQSGHIAVHETGAIEAVGHKVITATVGVDGKLTPTAIQGAFALHTDEHMVKPRMVYISQTTEIGGVYTEAELLAIRACCDELGLYLHVDGARLGAALAANSSMSLALIARVADVFYIGGTKNGALLGEAIVIVNPALQADFRYIIKQHGAMLAKGRVLGLQFLGLFEDGIFMACAQHAHQAAMTLAAGLHNLGCEFLTPPQSNQIFPILPNAVIDQLQQEFVFYPWQAMDDKHSAIRLVTSWATETRNIEHFLQRTQDLLRTNTEQ